MKKPVRSDSHKLWLLASVSIVCSTALLHTAHADDKTVLEDVVVSANRTPTAASSIGSSVTVITAEDIEKKQAVSLYDALDGIPGLHIHTSGNSSANARFKIRGYDSGRVLVLIDGVKIDSQASQMYDRPLSTIQASDIERIEVLKGSQSSLYGSDALGGVVSITTKSGKNSGKLIEGTANFELGTNVSRKASTSAWGTYKGVYYKVNAAGFATHGHDKRADVAPDESDGTRNVNYGVKLGSDLVKDYGVLDLINVEGNFNYSRGNSEYDSNSGGTDTDGFVKQRNKTALVKLQADLFDGLLKNTFTASRMDALTAQRTNRQTGYVSNYYGDLQRYEYEGVLQPHEDHTFVYGIEQERDHYKYYRDTAGVISRHDVQSLVNTSAYGQYGLDLFDKALSLTIGGRQEFHDTFGEHFTYRGTASYLYAPTETRLHGSYSTGFKAPTLKQLMYNVDKQPKPIEPEESQGYDLGIEQSLLDGRLILDVTGFYSRMKNEIRLNRAPGGSSNWYYENIGSARHMGIETSTKYMATDELSFDLAYTYTQSRNNENDMDMDIAPHHVASLRTTYEPEKIEGLATWVKVKAVSGSFDDNEDPRERSAGYTIWDLGADYKINDTYSVYGRVENLFDKSYSDRYHDDNAGISAAAGLRLKF